MYQVEDAYSTQGASIRYLASSVSKASLQSTTQALEQMATRSFSFHRFVLTTVASSFLSDGKPTDEKRAILAKLVLRALESSNGVTLVSGLLDQAPASTLWTRSSLRSFMTNDLKLTSFQQMQLALALKIGSHNDTAREAALEHLQQLDMSQALTLHKEEPELRSVALLARQVPELSNLAKVLAPSTEITPLRSIDSCTSTGATVSLAKVIEELGAVSISTASDCKDLLSIFPRKLNERDVADIFVNLSGANFTSNSEVNMYNSLRVSIGKKEIKSQSSGSNSLLVLLQTIRESNPTLNWDEALRCMDGCVGSGDERMDVIFDLYSHMRSGSGRNYPPISLFVGRWTNTARQGKALKYVLENVQHATRDLKGKLVPSEVAPDDSGDTHKVVQHTWRYVAFVETIVHVAAREPEFDAAVLQPALNKYPKVLFCALLIGSFNGTVKNFTAAAQILASHESSIESLLTPNVVQLVRKEGKLDALVGLLSEFTLSRPTRTVEIAEIILRNKIAEAVINASSSTRLIVAVVLCGRDSGQVRERWIETTLEERNRYRAGSSDNRFSVALAITEVAEELLNQNKHVSSAGAALATLQSSSIAMLIPDVIRHMRSMTEANSESRFPEDVEKEATDFFNRMYAEGDALATGAMKQIEQLSKSKDGRDQQLFTCIINIMLEEMSAVNNYPLKELRLFARFNGQVIASNILPAPALQRALELLLRAVVKTGDNKMQEYSDFALEQIKPRIAEWPQFGNQLLNIPDLDMHVPGIVAAIKRGIRLSESQGDDAEKQTKTPANKAAPTDPSNMSDPTAIERRAAAIGHEAGLHQQDISTLLTSARVREPPQVVKEQINFLVGNTDHQKLDTNAQELMNHLRPEYYQYFANYLVVKRASLEPNFHDLYIALVDRLQSRELEQAIREATVTSVRRLIGSESIKTDSSDRKLLKNLGSWYGRLTVGKSIPILTRDMDFKQMLYFALKEGKLIAIVAFIAQILQRCGTSPFFCPRNPWTMAQMCHLFELYSLVGLKQTLSFEVELLCKELNMNLLDIKQYAEEHQSRVRSDISMLDVVKMIDVSESNDFKSDAAEAMNNAAKNMMNLGVGMPSPVQMGGQAMGAPGGIGGPHGVPGGLGVGPGGVMNNGAQQGNLFGAQQQMLGMQGSALGGFDMVARPHTLQANAEPFEPKGGIPIATVPLTEIIGQSFPVFEVTNANLRLTADEERILAAPGRDHRKLLVDTLSEALSEIEPDINRATEMAKATTLSIVTKDFLYDRDSTGMRRAGQLMVRSLASNLCNTNFRVKFLESMTKHVSERVKSMVARAATDKDFHRELCSSIVNNNVEICNRRLEYIAAKEAGMKLDAELIAVANEKAKAIQMREFPIVPPDHLQAQQFLSVPGCPNYLNQPTTAIQKSAYEDYINCLPVVELFSALVRNVEELTSKHHAQDVCPPLSLASDSFSKNGCCETQNNIRNRLTTAANIVTSETAVYLVNCVLQKLLTLVSPIPSTEEQAPRLQNTRKFLYEVYWFFMHSIRERGGPQIAHEVTFHLLRSPRRWKSIDIITTLFRAKSVDIPMLDDALAQALNERGTDRAVVDFGMTLITVVIIDKRLATLTDFNKTIIALNAIAKNQNPQQQQQQPQGQQQQQQQQQQQGAMQAAHGVASPQEAGGQLGMPPSSAQLTPAQQQQQQHAALLARQGQAGAGAVPPGAPIAPANASGAAAGAKAPPGAAGTAPLAPLAAQSKDQSAPLSQQLRKLVPGAAPQGAGAGDAKHHLVGWPATAQPVTPEYLPHVTDIRICSETLTERSNENITLISKLFDEWIDVCAKKSQRSHSSDNSQRSPSVEYVRKLQYEGMLDSANLDTFLGVIMQLCVEHYATKALELERKQQAASSQIEPKPEVAPPPRYPFSSDLFTKVDGFSDLVVVLVRCCSVRNDATYVRAETSLVQRVLLVFVKILTDNHNAIMKKFVPKGELPPTAAYQLSFQQQPYVRFISNLLITLPRHDGEDRMNLNEEITTLFADALHSLAPLRYPGMAFGWLELVAHRIFLARCIRSTNIWHHYARLLVDALEFFEVFTHDRKIPAEILVLYRAFFKLMLVLLHDFPQFVIIYHYQLCDFIPPYCTQLLNTVLCAFPEDLVLPDPFISVQNNDPEIRKKPPTENQISCIKDTFHRCKFNESHLTAAIKDATPIQEKYMQTVVDQLKLSSSTRRWNTQLINAVVLHTALTYLDGTDQEVLPTFGESNAMSLYRYLVQHTDCEGRYLVLCACASHLRYPNSHSNFFSKVLFQLFLPHRSIKDEKLQLAIQEQMTRVIAEKTVISRPHPWGVLSTFVELMRKEEYDFWNANKQFTTVTNEMNMMFQTLRTTIQSHQTTSNASGNAAQQQQQQQQQQHRN